MDAQALTKLLYHQSGLLGVSGLSSDMRVLLESDTGAAQEAVALFVYRIARELGSLAAALGGLDALIFTGGIGENATQIRSMICAQAVWLGVDIDENANQGSANCISTPNAKVSVWVVPTNENLMIARHTLRLIGM
jgi:acetate kinase